KPRERTSSLPRNARLADGLLTVGASHLHSQGMHHLNPVRPSERCRARAVLHSIARTLGHSLTDRWVLRDLPLRLDRRALMRTLHGGDHPTCSAEGVAS